MSGLRVIEGGVSPDEPAPIVWNRQPIEDQRCALVIRDNADPWEPVVLAWDDGRPFLIGIRCIRLPADAAALEGWKAVAVVGRCEIRDERTSPDVFGEADANNARTAVAARLEHERRARELRRAHQPMPSGGLFDQVQRGTQELL